MILFNSGYGTCPWLSNFHMKELFLDGCWWESVEHYYQAMKFFPHQPDIVLEIRKCSTPGKTKRIARQYRHAIRDDWESVKRDVMLSALRAKFLDAELRTRLLQTDNEELVEYAPWGDTYWGVNKDYVGENWLGRLLIRVRAECYEEEYAPFESGEQSLSVNAVKWRAAVMEKDLAWYWNWLYYHPKFNVGCNVALEQNLQISVEKVNPETNEINSDSTKNTKVEIWLEYGGYTKELRPNGLPYSVHDIQLDCGGSTFEEAIVNLASLVLKYYGDYDWEKEF